METVVKRVFSLSEIDNTGSFIIKRSLDFQVITDTSNLLATVKQTIQEHFWDFDWDKFKKLVNDFELIYTNGASVANIRPVSRSYFKLHEILVDFQNDMALPLEPINALFLADGPGGFIEAFYKYRMMTNTCDKLYGVTLISKDKSIPTWKIRDRLPSSNLSFLNGLDGTGSLYNIHNIHRFADVVGRGSCSFITADGGFDFSNDFNNQERSSHHLVLCEMYTALLMQKEKGSFVVKMYDLFTVETLQLLSILRMVYQSVYITKPHTSRPANSEKYIVCTGFKSCPLDIMYQLRTSVITKQWCIKLKPFASVTSDIASFNTHFVCKQIYEINKVVNAIRSNSTCSEVVHKHMENALRWCYKYGIPVNTNALHHITSNSTC